MRVELCSEVQLRRTAEAKEAAPVSLLPAALPGRPGVTVHLPRGQQRCRPAPPVMLRSGWGLGTWFVGRAEAPGRSCPRVLLPCTRLWEQQVCMWECVCERVSVGQGVCEGVRMGWGVCEGVRMGYDAAGVYKIVSLRACQCEEHMQASYLLTLQVLVSWGTRHGPWGEG